MADKLRDPVAWRQQAGEHRCPPGAMSPESWGAASAADWRDVGDHDVGRLRARVGRRADVQRHRVDCGVASRCRPAGRCRSRDTGAPSGPRRSRGCRTRSRSRHALAAAQVLSSHRGTAGWSDGCRKAECESRVAHDRVPSVDQRPAAWAAPSSGRCHDGVIHSLARPELQTAIAWPAPSPGRALGAIRSGPGLSRADRAGAREQRRRVGASVHEAPASRAASRRRCRLPGSPKIGARRPTRRRRPRPAPMPRRPRAARPTRPPPSRSTTNTIFDHMSVRVPGSRAARLPSGAAQREFLLEVVDRRRRDEARRRAARVRADWSDALDRHLDSAIRMCRMA